MAADKSMQEAIGKAREAWNALDGKKGLDMVLLDVHGASAITDCILIATCTSAPHLKALANEVQVALKKKGMPCYRKAGTPEGGWLALDYLDVIIHIFLAERRNYYAIEDLWPHAPRIPPDRTPPPPAPRS